MKKYCSRIVFLLVCVVLLGLRVPATAQTSDWINPGIGDWSVPANWSAGVPADPRSAVISNGGTAQITSDVTGPTMIRIGVDAAPGTLELLSGRLSNAGLSIGAAGTFRLAGDGVADLYSINGPGTIEQTDGFVTMWEWFVNGSYNNSGGLLEIRNRLGLFGGSQFELSGDGEVDVAQQLDLSSTQDFRQTGGKLTSRYETEITRGAVYHMQGGTADHASTYVRTNGMIDLVDGEFNVGRLLISQAGLPGKARVSGGTLALHNSLLNGSGPIDFQAGSWTLDVRGGIVSLYNAVMADVSQATLRSSAGTLTILPTGVDPNAFAVVDTQGVVHVAGAPLTLPSGEFVYGMGDVPDRLIVEGQLIARDTSTNSGLDPAINALNGIRVLPGGAAKLGRGQITVRDQESGMLGGDLRANLLVVGLPGLPGKFVQTGGVFDDEDNSSDSPELRIGHAAGAKGVYEMSDGEILADEIWVGWQGDGEFRQSGGLIDLKYSTGSAVILGPNGRYELSGGELRSYELAVLGRFVQTGGVHHNHWGTGDNDIGEPGASAVYELRGGRHRVDGILSLARFDSSQGTYVVSDNGRLEAARLFMRGPGISLFRVDGGEVLVGQFAIGIDGVGNHLLELANREALFEVSQRLTIGTNAEIKAVPGSVIHLTGAPVEIRATDSVKLSGLNNVAFVFAGGATGAAPLEVAGHDLGAVAAGFRDNFALAGLTVGANQIGRVRLVDLFNNSPGSEAMYVRRLTIGPGSTLDLNGFKLYYGELYLDPMAILIHNGGELIQSPVPELGSLLLALEGLWLGVAIGWRRTDSFRGGGVRGTYDHAFSA